MTARGGLGLAALLAALVLAPGRVAGQPDPRPIEVKEVAVEGNRRVQEAVILGRVQTRTGNVFNPSQVSEDIRSIFGLGFFDDVRVRVEDFEGGVKVTYVVVERPFIRDVEFAGNRRIATADLQAKIDLKLGSVYNPVEVQRARERLQQHYEEEGYFEVQITPEIERFADGDVRLTFRVEEGRRLAIDRVQIRGNQGLTERQIKAVLLTQERYYFFLRGRLQRQLIDQDIEQILALYADHGYVQARVESHEVDIDRERGRVTLTYTVVEGPQYRVQEIRITGVSLFPESELQRLVLLKPGDVFSRSRLRDSVRQILDLYSTIGRAAADVNPRTLPEAAAGTTTIFLDISEGPEVYVERINIRGNLRSQDKILRREIPMAEGDLFTLQRLQRARQRLLNLGYFETVDLTTLPGSDRTRIIVNVDVVERPTGLFSIGGGFSSADSFLGTIDLSQRNFLGRGWELTARLRLGARLRQGILSFTEPWLFDRPLSAGFDLFSTRREFSEYDYATLGGQLRTSHPFAEFWRWHLTYRLTRDKISDVEGDAVATLGDEVGVRLTSLVGGAVVRDSRDSVVAPTRGGQLSLNLDVAGLGGDSRFVKTGALATRFWPIWFGHVVSLRGDIGYAFGWGGEEVPLFERYFLGGPNTVRGVKFRRISPEDDNGNRIGGTSQVLGNLEYIIPLPFNLRLAAFFDAGNVYGFGTTFNPLRLREAAGGGVRWLSPFGPIRVDYGVNLDRKAGEDFGALHFSVGSPF